MQWGFWCSSLGRARLAPWRASNPSSQPLQTYKTGEPTTFADRSLQPPGVSDGLGGPYLVYTNEDSGSVH